MNVVRTLVSSNSEPLNLASRQDRDASSREGSSGFSQALGSIDKNTSQKPASSDTSRSSSTSQTQDPAQDAPSGTVSDTGKDASATPIAADKQSASTKSEVKLPVLPDLSETANASSMPKVGEMDIAAQSANADTGSVTSEELSDLAKLVAALTKSNATSAQEAKDGSEVTDDGSDKDAPSPDDTANNGTDILSLLTATVVPANPAVNANANVASQQPAQDSALQSIGQSLGGGPIDADGASTTTVRLEKQDTPAVDLHIDTNEDGSMKVDVSAAAGATPDVVQVVESRRFLGLAPTSNAAAITSAMTSDHDWAAALADKTAGKPMIASTGQVVHTLKIQMNPVELGHITAALKLVGDELSVHLTAHTLKGYAELQKDSSGILDALKSQGFSVEHVTVNLSTGTDRQDSGAGNRQPADPGQQGAQYGNQRGGDARSQDQFSRQSRAGAGEEVISNDSSIQTENSPRGASARPGQLYL